MKKFLIGVKKIHSIIWLSATPCFELWFIFHHELNKQQLKEIREFGANQHECIEFCEKYFSYRKKRPNFKGISIEDVKRAVSYAKKVDTTDESGWPVEPGCTTVYRIIENYFVE